MFSDASLEQKTLCDPIALLNDQIIHSCPLITYEENAEKIIVAEILIISIAPATIKIAPALVAMAGTLSPAHVFVSTVSTIASTCRFDVEKLPRAEQNFTAISANLHQLHKQFYLCI